LEITLPILKAYFITKQNVCFNGNFGPFNFGYQPASYSHILRSFYTALDPVKFLGTYFLNFPVQKILIYLLFKWLLNQRFGHCVFTRGYFSKIACTNPGKSTYRNAGRTLEAAPSRSGVRKTLRARRPSCRWRHTSGSEPRRTRIGRNRTDIFRSWSRRTMACVL